MKKSRKKLRLARTTIRHLTDLAQLGVVVGGATENTVCGITCTCTITETDCGNCGGTSAFLCTEDTACISYELTGCDCNTAICT